MLCPRCRTEAPARTKFCAECGAPLPTSCRHCAAVLPPAAKFCPECGMATADGPSTSTAAAPAPAAFSRFASPSAYTPKHLAERILVSRESLEGERKQVTVLFADLKGSMELLADRDPEEARAILDPVLERMIDAVHRYEGTVNQVMGDGIMALFGAPLAHEDHAVRACYAALRMQYTVKEYAETLHRTTGVPIHIRVGLNSGDVVVRSIGSDLHMDYTAVGQTTHLAARMEQMAMPGTILASADTLRLAEGYVTVTPLGARPVKGLEAPVDVYEVMAAAAARSRLHAAAARGLSRFVGRDPELERLRQALERARAGHGQVVAVVGEAGVGKSRLFWEFTHSHHTSGWLILESTSVSYGHATSYLPVIQLLRSYFGLEERADPRTMRERVTGKLLALDEGLRPLLAPILSLLEVPVDDRDWTALDPAVRRQRTLDAVKRLILRESQVQPVVVVAEDLHWIDAATQAVLDGLVESVPTARVVLLLNYRPEYRHGWGGKTYYTQLRIDPLTAESAELFLETLLGPDPGLRPVWPLLIQRTDGNPFFLEETIRTLIETGIVEGERGAYRLRRSIASIQVPATVQAVLSARIDRLPLPVKHLLQAAAVVGKQVPLLVLEAVAEQDPDELLHGLTQLQAAEFLYESNLFPELEYTFRHALTLEVTYQGLLRERRRGLHQRVLRALEQHRPGYRSFCCSRVVVRSSRSASTVITCMPISGLCRTRSRKTLEEILKVTTGLLALTVVVRLPRQSTAISPNRVFGPMVFTRMLRPVPSLSHTSVSPSAMMYTASARSPCWTMTSSGSKRTTSAVSAMSFSFGVARLRKSGMLRSVSTSRSKGGIGFTSRRRRRPGPPDRGRALPSRSARHTSRCPPPCRPRARGRARSGEPGRGGRRRR
jgi:class 3 adenylate cyclase